MARIICNEKGLRTMLFLAALLACFQLFPDEASASIPSPFIQVVPPFEGEGEAVEAMANAGGVVGGVAGGIVAIPIAIAGTIVTFPFGKSEAGATAGLVVFFGGQMAGQYLIAGPVYLLKKVFFDLPMALFRIDTEKEVSAVFRPEENENK